MKLPIGRCILCGQQTSGRCAYCSQPICSHCHVVHNRKSYCRPLHRDKDAGIGHLLRKLDRSLRQYAS
ncbi:MAG TPA: hypothetical protein VFB12_25385 [Ktedonobacteraceae bacterium]|jgi:hypothetical protein|nr:hypothetical protein [Ktedonobacteraceae bacterium]